MGTLAEQTANSIMEEVSKKNSGLHERDIYQVLNMIAYRCRTMIEELDQRPDERQKIYDEQRMKPYH